MSLIRTRACQSLVEVLDIYEIKVADLQKVEKNTRIDTKPINIA